MVYNPALINEVYHLDFELPPRPPVLIRQNAAIYTPPSPPPQHMPTQITTSSSLRKRSNH